MSNGQEPIAWEFVTSDGLGENAALSFDFRLTPKEAATRIDLFGLCPRCGHEMIFEWPLVLLRSTIESPTGLPTSEEEVAMRCTCGVAHAHRPEDEPDGCGAYWKLYVPRG